jgi:ADP-dependent NAD(P)H-hydrate dehydratase / NAD(P)H-hydrate epimerase
MAMMASRAWLEPLPAAQEMRAIDAWAIEEQGIPSLDLMERAGAGVARVVEELIPAGRLVAVCGKGNNGGDGLVAARLLRDKGRQVDVVLAAGADELSPDARANLDRLTGASPTTLEEAALDSAAGVIDALLGTGFRGQAEGDMRAAMEAIEAATTTVVAADVPSGVDASTGAVSGPAVHARATATFHAAKPGLWIAPGKLHAGEVRVIDIGIPEGAPGNVPIGLIRRDVLRLIPTREQDGTKFTSGQVLVAGGSPGLTGAPSLAALAAMRAGAGYVTACVPESLSPIFEGRLLEAMTLALPDQDGVLLPEGVDAVLDKARSGAALVVGPGLGREEPAEAFARELAREAGLALVLDADGLNAHADALSLLAGRRAPTVLTPHAGELGRLLGVESSAVAAQRLEHVRDAAARSRSVVVLKGDDTLVAAPDGTVAVSPGGSPALATAGTGDVLSGVVAALLAKGLDAFPAACAAVHLHAVAGRRAADLHGPEGVIASDVIDALPRARAG